ncbi:hypothetical protein MKX75_07650 [Paenibacillus sp. FSL R5-0341]|uniref:hypothetical protein n=1 Tax=Paenibacillus sp. FSL R5-0341 TaxID=2921636 RepID=UPI0030D1CE99
MSLLDTFNIIATLIIALIGSIVVPIVIMIKQNKEKVRLKLRVKLALSNLGAGEEHRYQYVILNTSQRSTYISEVYIELYEFNKFIDRIKYIPQVESSDGDEINRNVLPNTSSIGWLPESEDYKNPNIFIRLAVYTQDLEVFKSDFFDPRISAQLSEFKVKKLKMKHQ